MHPPILGRPAVDGPRHARPAHVSSPRHPHHTRRVRRRIALLVTLFVVPTAATLSDVAGRPMAAEHNTSLLSVATSSDPSPPRSGDPKLSALRTGQRPGATPATTLVLAAAGDTIWEVAADRGVAPGVVLRHNRTFDDGHAGAGATADDALTSGRPLERAELLVVPAPASQAEPRTDGHSPRPDSVLHEAPGSAGLEPVFDRWADHFGVPRDLLKALAWVESGWDNDTRSSAGGVGIGRLQPMRAQYLADHIAGMPLDPTVTVDNIALTAAQLRVLLDETPDVRSAVAAHRQGIIDTRMSGVDPLLDGYVDAVLALRLRFA